MKNEIAVTKTIGPDRDRIDYTHDNTGVRVRRGTGQAIARASVNSEWLEHGPAYSLSSLNNSFGSFAQGSSMPLAPVLAHEIGRMEQSRPELRKLVTGELSFDDAVSTP